MELKRKGRSPNTIAGYEQVYAHNIEPTLGRKPVTKVTTKTLTDLYGAHQARGLSARSVYQIHACLSSMFSQACRRGWRESNPAQWAEPPSIPNNTPVVPTPEEVRALIDAAEQSRRPEYAQLILIAATTGLRRAELRSETMARSRPRARTAPRLGIRVIETRNRRGDPDEEPTGPHDRDR